VLAKVTSAFYRRDINIGSLSAAPTHRAEVAKIVISATAPRAVLERVAAGLNNLVDILSVEWIGAEARRARELCLVRVAAADAEERGAILAAAAPFAARVVEASAESVVLAVSDAPPAVALLLDALAPFAIVDVSRSGAIALPGAAGLGAGGA
jgi:acetolactate synthase-1/3 small subunit